MGKFIFDKLTGTPTILATERAKRVDQTGAVSTIAKSSTEQKPCFFCKGNEHLTPPTTYQDKDDWSVRSFDNKFKLLDDHEVIVHSPSHEVDIEDAPHEQNVHLIRAYLNRTDFYGAQGKEVIIFNNRGGRAGASILHPHSQIVASKGFPGTVEHEKSAALHYFNENNSCFWCDEVKQELLDKNRIIYESTHFVAYVPSDCRWSYEVRLVPKNHKPNFGFIDEMEINDLASMLKGVLIAYNGLFNRPDRNFWIHSVRYEPYHWHLGFLAHIKVFGALEIGAGIWVSDKATPEDAASQLKKHFVYSTNGDH